MTIRYIDADYAVAPQITPADVAHLKEQASPRWCATGRTGRPATSPHSPRSPMRRASMDWRRCIFL